MNGTSVYQIQIKGRVREEVLNSNSPSIVTVNRTDAKLTQFTVEVDQSGLIGLLRHLHGRGFSLLSVFKEG